MSLAKCKNCFYIFLAGDLFSNFQVRIKQLISQTYYTNFKNMLGKFLNAISIKGQAMAKILGVTPSLKNQKSSDGLSSIDYKRYSLTPRFSRKNYSNKDLQEKAQQILQWAKSHGATHYTFLSYPQTEGVSEKQQALFDLSYSCENGLSSSVNTALTVNSLLKSQGDGSSFPSGGLRQTHSARAYMIWDTKSDIFLRKTNNVVYIPSLLVSHNGEGLDDKTLLRKTELKLQERVTKLLEKIGIKAYAVYMALGLQQQLFIIPKNSFCKRLDLRSTGRTLISDIPPKNQQFSDHYYGKIPHSIEEIFIEVQKQLFSIGVPIKIRHKQVAINQFQFCPLFEEVGKAIDHNMITMEILKEVFDKNGYTVLLHEKPFQELNGSGKHCNWSLHYVEENGKLQNLFQFPNQDSPQTIRLFKLFILINLKALNDYAKLYMASISIPGNELRLGGHEAPPRIISTFLGDAVTNILDNKINHKAKNLKQCLNLPYNLFQQNTDRNRTSPYAFAGNRFEFRGVGSSQNVCYPMAVIGATITATIDKIFEKLNNGSSIDDVIKLLTDQSKNIRFQGNGYSESWIQQAKKRGLYVNENFWEAIQNLKTQAHVFADIGVCSQQVIQAKYVNSANFYINTVDLQYKTLWIVISKNIMPRGFSYLASVTNSNYSGAIQQRAIQFTKVFDELCDVHKKMSADQDIVSKSTKEACEKRELLYRYSKKVNKVLEFLPKDQNFPDLVDFMNLY